MSKPSKIVITVNGQYIDHPETTYKMWNNKLVAIKQQSGTAQLNIVFQDFLVLEFNYSNRLAI
jgi:hypothetical protein